jgi:hypothetical protein
MRKVSPLFTVAKRAGVGVLSKRIWTEHPYLKDICDGVVGHFGKFMSETMLLEKALLAASMAYGQAIRSASAAPQQRYLAALFGHLTPAFAVDARIGNAIWNPTGSESFAKFCEQGAVIYANILRPLSTADAFEVLLTSHLKDEGVVAGVIAEYGDQSSPGIFPVDLLPVPQRGRSND